MLIVSGLRVPIVAVLVVAVPMVGLWWLTPRTRDTWSIHLFAMGHALLGGAVCAIRS